MSPVQKRRMLVVMMLVIGAGGALALVLYALKQNINLFYSPSQLASLTLPENKTFRLGGMVVKNSLIRHDDLHVEFLITDYKKQIKVHYSGILPDLFKENQGIVALGVLKQGEFEAKEVLAKHDEKYMPPEVAQALKG
ncbi:MAG: cytochrome c maturation protein CcmE [Proteobacteria bacterium]|nr:cytochrome c maturation protein CcmE [Pseudomonadota bacterium]